jgi:hypothetical protein
VPRIRECAAYCNFRAVASRVCRTAAEFNTIRLYLIKVAGRVTEMVTRIKIALPTDDAYQTGFATLAGQIAKLPP